MAGKAKIGAGLSLDGEKEFKQAISGINKDLAVLGSEMGKVTAQFGNNANSMDALKAKSEVYNKQIEEQKKKIETLKAALANSAEEFGENDVKTKNWQISLNKAEAELAKTETALSLVVEQQVAATKELSEYEKAQATFAQATTKINSALSVLASELSKVDAKYGDGKNSAEALAEKNRILNDSYFGLMKKCQETSKALEAAKKEYGEGSEEVNKLKIALNNAETELYKTRDELDKNTKQLDEFGKEADETGKELDETGKSVDNANDKFSKFGGALKASAAAMAAVGAAAGLAAVQLGKAVINAYGDYEQLVGGVDTLFKESSLKLQEYAANAYKTAGLSANDYMETVTSFSASLLQSLGGDTEKAVKYADMAITDMSDNANKMGTDMASIQNAYQGFAKQNYTMLDNLKLGYGGTKSEMERLLVDAGKIAGVKFDISSYADVVEAIHVMQESMGIAGTTALEAEETIQGSIKAMSSAWQNMLVGFGNADADMAALTGMLVDSFQTVVKNITPVIDNIAKALPEAFDAALGVLGDLLPTLLGTVTDLFKQVLDTLLKIMPELIPVAVDAILTIVDTLVENLPLLIEAAFELITALANGIIEALPELVPKIVEVVNKIVTTITENLPLIIGAALKIIIALAGGLIQAIPELVKSVPQLIGAIVKAFSDSMNQIKDIGKAIVEGVWEGIKAKATWFTNQVKSFFKGIVDSVKNVLGIASPSKVFAGIGEFMAAGLGQGFENEMRNVAKQINNSIPTSINITGQDTRGTSNTYGDTVIYVNNPQPSPAELARQIAKTQRDLALGFY